MEWMVLTNFLTFISQLSQAILVCYKKYDILRKRLDQGRRTLNSTSACPVQHINRQGQTYDYQELVVNWYS